MVKTVPSIINLAAHYKFAQGNPVPDGMTFSTITATNHPSNIIVFEAETILEASDKALHAFKHGKQGAIWLNANDLRFVDDPLEFPFRDDAVYSYMHNAAFELEKKFPELLTTNLRSEKLSDFDPHFDDFALKLSDHFRSPAVKEFRIVINFDGIPTIVFGKNSVLADKIARNKKNIPVEEYGHAYISPIGSALFILGGNVGLRHALLHAFPEVPPSEGKVVRELAVIECSVT